MKHFILLLISFVTVEVSQAKSLVLALHGCKQNGLQFATGSRLMESAKKSDFILLTPSQSQMANIDHCWNWFYSSNQMRDSLASELFYLKNLVVTTAKQNSIPSNKIYLVGMSAGAAMAANLAICYPDVFSGVALHSGIPYHANKHLYDVNDILKQGSSYNSHELLNHALNCAQSRQGDLQLKNVIIFHGDLDVRNTYSNSQSSFHQLSRLMSELYSKPEITWASSEQIFEPKNQHKYTLKTFFNLYDDVSVKYYLIHGMAHAWSGGDENYPNNDARGPNATELIIEAFGL